MTKLRMVYLLHLDPRLRSRTISCSDLSTERPNPEYAQDNAQRRTQANMDMAAHVEIGQFRSQISSFWTRCAVRFQRPSRLRGVVDPFEEVV